jgi:uncharacterized damage-inducible protein DinB
MTEDKQMKEPALTANEALKWLDSTSGKWRQMLGANPQILALPCNVARTTTVGGLLQHIVAVELRYAERLNNQPESDYANIPFDTVDAIYATHDSAAALYTQALDSGCDWDEEIEFNTRTAGRLRASRKTVFFHALFHSIRHYAQLGTLVREHGYPTDWPGDYLFLGARRA